MPETEWKIEDKSTGSDIDKGGSKVEEEPWELPPDSEKDVDISFVPVESEEASREGEARVAGLMTVTLFEDETIKVEFPNVGRWTLGRLEKAMSPIYRQIIIERAKVHRKSVGLPEDFNMEGANES